MPQCTFFSTKKRQKLVDLVINHGISIAKAARKLTIKGSTAKRIIKVFKITGAYSMKTSRNIAKESVESIAIASIPKIEEPPLNYQEHK